MDYMGTGIPCKGCVSHTVYLEYGNSKGEEIRSRYLNNSKRELRNMQERKVGMKKKIPNKV